jgi:pentose-5-phosphate-3-epimerase
VDVSPVGVTESNDPDIAQQKRDAAAVVSSMGAGRICDRRDLRPLIEVDGDENSVTTCQAVAFGLSVIVVDSTIFGSDNFPAAIAAIRTAVTAATIRS